MGHLDKACILDFGLCKLGCLVMFSGEYFRLLLGIILTLLYYKRSLLTDFLLERRKARSGLEFSEYPTKLTANPDFMASLAPTWPEPEPDPTEDQAFIQQQVSVGHLTDITLLLRTDTDHIFYLTLMIKYGLEKGI